MSNGYVITGKIVGGAGKAAFFTQLDWVQQQCALKLNFKPHPGTLNIEVDRNSRQVLEFLTKQGGIELNSPNPDYCHARSLKASLINIRGAIIIPDGKVKIHRGNIVEMIAPVSIKNTLSLNNGDPVEVVIEML